MQCKTHPNRPAEHFCTSCGIPLCDECAEQSADGDYFCFQCAMVQTVSGVGTTLKDKKEKAEEKKRKKKKEWSPFHYFLIVSSTLIVVMWGVIIFGGQKAPAGTGEFAKNERVFLFMVDSAVKRYAHYEGKKYPGRLEDLVPKYLTISDENLIHLKKLSYQKRPGSGYRLSLANPKPGEMKIMMSQKGITYESPTEE
ncbi:B-box zinc finger protein [Thermodesulfobacteriota bacterium]